MFVVFDGLFLVVELEALDVLNPVFVFEGDRLGLPVFGAGTESYTPNLPGR